MQVLTVNQIVDLLLKFHETGDWKRACEHVVPARKTQAQTQQVTALEVHGQPPPTAGHKGDDAVACSVVSSDG